MRRCPLSGASGRIIVDPACVLLQRQDFLRVIGRDCLVVPEEVTGDPIVMNCCSLGPVCGSEFD